MQKSPPAQVNERSARLMAGLVVVLLCAAWLADATWALPLLASGFVLRAVWGPSFSPLAGVAAQVANRLWTARPVPARPKRFAQAMGAACLIVASALVLAGRPAPAWAVGGLVGLLASLEAATGFCVGCRIYAFLIARGWVRQSVCIDCARPESRARRDQVPAAP